MTISRLNSKELSNNENNDNNRNQMETRLRDVFAEFEEQIRNKMGEFDDKVKNVFSEAKTVVRPIEILAEDLRASLSQNITAIETSVTTFLKEMKIVADSRKQSLENKQDSIDHNFRINSLLIHGIDESENEITDTVVIDFVKGQLGIALSMEGIDYTHRLGRPKIQDNTRPRPIVVNFVSYRTRADVFSNKSKLDRIRKFSVTEFLTPKRREMLTEARQLMGTRNVWTRDGTVMVNLSDGSRMKINSPEDLVVLKKLEL